MTFTVDQAAKRWRCSPELVEEFLRDFAAAGFVRKHTTSEGTTWSVAEKGAAIASLLAHTDDREPVA